MGIVANTEPSVTPIALSAVKTALGSGETYQELTDFRDGGSAGWANIGGALGMINTSAGLIHLTEFQDVTKANLRGNIFVDVHSTEELEPSASVTVYFRANGRLDIFSLYSTTHSGNADGSFTTEWLMQNSTPCLTGTANNWEIRLTKTGGSDSGPSFNNIYTVGGTQQSASVSAARGTKGTTTSDLRCSVSIRRADSDVVVHTGVLDIEASVTQTNFS